MKLTFEEIGCVERKWPEGVPFPEFDELRFYKHGGQPMDATTVMIESDFCRALHLGDGAHGVMIYPERGRLCVEVWQADTKLASFQVVGAYLAELIDMATSVEAQTMGEGTGDDV